MGRVLNEWFQINRKTYHLAAATDDFAHGADAADDDNVFWDLMLSIHY